MNKSNMSVSLSLFAFGVLLAGAIANGGDYDKNELTTWCAVMAHVVCAISVWVASGDLKSDMGKPVLLLALAASAFSLAPWFQV